MVSEMPLDKDATQTLGVFCWFETGYKSRGCNSIAVVLV